MVTVAAVALQGNGLPGSGAGEWDEDSKVINGVLSQTQWQV